MVISEELLHLKQANAKIQRRNEKELLRIQHKIHKMKVKAWVEVDRNGMPFTPNKESRAPAGIAYLGTSGNYNTVKSHKSRRKSRS